jgi:putative transposase
MNKENSEFDFQAALKAIQSGKPLLGKEGILTPLIKDLTEAALEGELDSHLGQEVSANRRNGKSKKTIKSLNGNFELSTPRDRDGTFSPQLVKKHQTTLTDEIEQKIIALYGLGMSYNDISSHIQEMYGLEVSTGTLSAVTDKIINTVKEWQGRPLETIYPIVWLDAIHYKIRENGKVIGKQAGVEIVSPTMGEKKETIICLSEFEPSASGKILACPQGLAPETVKKKKARHTAAFNSLHCSGCPNQAHCPVKKGKKHYYLRYTEKEMRIAKRRAYEQTDDSKDR